MRHPVKVTCNFCHVDIDTKEPWTTFDVAVPKDVADQVHDRWKADAPTHAVFPGMALFVPTPTHYTLDVCRACEEKKMPDLRPMVAVLVLTKLEESRERAARDGAKPQFKED